MGEGVHVSPKDIRVHPVILPTAVVLGGAVLATRHASYTYRVWMSRPAALWHSSGQWDVTQLSKPDTYIGTIGGSNAYWPTLQQALDVRNTLR